MIRSPKEKRLRELLSKFFTSSWLRLFLILFNLKHRKKHWKGDNSQASKTLENSNINIKEFAVRNSSKNQKRDTNDEPG